MKFNAKDANELSAGFYVDVTRFYEKNKGLIMLAITDEIKHSARNGYYQCNLVEDLKSLCLQPRYLGRREIGPLPADWIEGAAKLGMLKELVIKDLEAAGYSVLGDSSVYTPIITWDKVSK